MSNNHNTHADIFFWQINPWQKLCEAKMQQRLPHAILILSACHLEAERFARAFAHVMLCRNASIEGNTCGDCHACHLVKANAHPDFIYLAAKQPGQMIKVDEVREVVQLVHETSMQNGYKVIIIDRAYNLNHSAANALLKTLEEPPPNTLFMLLSRQASDCQATITSRCQKLILPKPLPHLALHWLKSQLSDATFFSDEAIHIALNIATGAPLKALSMLQDDTMSYREVFYQGLAALSQQKADPLQLAALWSERDLHAIFHLLFYWLMDVLKWKMCGEKVIINTDYRKIFAVLTVTRKDLLSYLTHVQDIYKKIRQACHLNRQLLLEELLIRWALISR